MFAAQSLAAIVSLFLINGIHARSLQSNANVCSQKSCQRGGQAGDNNALSASDVKTAPCWVLKNGVAECYGYGTDGKCPFPGLTDCSKVSTPTVTDPGTGGGSKSPTTTPAPPPDVEPNNSSSSSVWPYVVGGAVALVAIGFIVYMLVTKSSRNAEEDEEDVVVYVKPNAGLPEMDQFKTENRQDYRIPLDDGGSVDSAKPAFAAGQPQKQGVATAHVARQNPLFPNQQNASFIQQKASYMNQSNNNGSLVGDRPTKEQFFVAHYDAEAGFGSQEKASRKSSYEF